MKPEHRQFFADLSEAQILGLCIWAEARGEGEEGRIAVGSVVLNRAEYGKAHDPWGRRFGNCIHGVVLAPAQFSWTMAMDPQYEKCVKIARDFEGSYHDHASLFTMHGIALGLLQGNIERNVKALYYHTLAVRPKWARNMKAERIIGNHIFYEG